MTRTEAQLEQVCYASNLDLLVDKIDDLTEASTDLSVMEEIASRIDVDFESNKNDLESMINELQDFDQKGQDKWQEREATMTLNMKTITSAIQQEH